MKSDIYSKKNTHNNASIIWHFAEKEREKKRINHFVDENPNQYVHLAMLHRTSMDIAIKITEIGMA